MKGLLGNSANPIKNSIEQKVMQVLKFCKLAKKLRPRLYCLDMIF